MSHHVNLSYFAHVDVKSSSNKPYQMAMGNQVEHDIVCLVMLTYSQSGTNWWMVFQNIFGIFPQIVWRIALLTHVLSPPIMNWCWLYHSSFSPSISPFFRAHSRSSHWAVTVEWRLSFIHCRIFTGSPNCSPCPEWGHGWMIEIYSNVESRRWWFRRERHVDPTLAVDRLKSSSSVSRFALRKRRNFTVLESTTL